MSWIRETQKPWYHRLCINILRSGPIPKHVAFIMDGNRRFARKNCLAQAEGHMKGFDKLAQTLEWCLDLGIEEVTVYAFSIENFKRSKEEVSCLMELARQKFEQLLNEKEMIQKHNVCIRVLGNLALIPDDVRAVVAEAVNMTRGNTGATLNVCFSYTSRDEISEAMKQVAIGVQDGDILESDITEELLSQSLYTNLSPDPDFLVRTSGEVRLSDFLLWQSTYSVLSFMTVLWPDFSVWHLYAGILHYQRNYDAVQAALRGHQAERDERQLQADRACVMRAATLSGLTLQQRLEEHREKRLQRTAKFLQKLQLKRDSLWLKYPS